MEICVTGVAPATRRMRKQLERAIRDDAPVLITGPTGSGKELVAREIHRRSRGERPFVAVNLVDRSRSLLSSTIFGHERGAFTGADRRRVGRLQEARDGTLFLDEFGEIPLDVQPMFLRVLEERTFRPEGGDHDIPLEARVVAATNRNLTDEMKAKTFRSDLYHRIAHHRVEVPALDSRREDFRAIGQSIVPHLQVTEAAWRLLEARPYEGNVRELRNLLVEMSSVCESAGIPTLDADIVKEILGSPESPSDDDAIDDVARYAMLRGVNIPGLRKVGRRILELSYEDNRQNLSATANACGAARSTIRRVLRKKG